MLEGIDFLNKQLFWVFLTIPLAILWYVFKYKKQTTEFKISSIKGFKLGSSLLPKFRHVLFLLRLVALALLITALARPQTVDVSTKTNIESPSQIVVSFWRISTFKTSTKTVSLDEVQPLFPITDPM